MINCAHPTHFEHVLERNAGWMKRLRGLRANSSRRSHAELDNTTELDAGNPEELGAQYGDLLRRFPHINVLGGCWERTTGTSNASAWRAGPLLKAFDSGIDARLCVGVDECFDSLFYVELLKHGVSVVCVLDHFACNPPKVFHRKL
jgi:hypothetical protein